MNVLGEIKSFVKNSDEFTRKNFKTVLGYSTILKIAAFALLLFKILHPYLLLINSLIFISASLFCDCKILTNIQRITLNNIKQKIRSNPYETGHFMGQILAIIIKPDSFDTLKGFYHGFKEQLF